MVSLAFGKLDGTWTGQEDLLGRWRRGIECEMMTRAPEKSPAAPIPATARPTINISEDTDVAQIKLPTSKRNRKARYVHFREKYWYSFPDMGWRAHLLFLSDWVRGKETGTKFTRKSRTHFHTNPRHLAS